MHEDPLSPEELFRRMQPFEIPEYPLYDKLVHASDLSPQGLERVNSKPHSESSLGEKGRALLENFERASAQEKYHSLHWSGTFSEYLGKVLEHPDLARNAWQRIAGMLEFYGQRPGEDGLTHYNLFDDPFSAGSDAVFGLDKPISELATLLKAGAEGLGPERRILLLHGPVGTAKSTIVRLLKRGLQDYSQHDEGALYTLGFKIREGHPDYDRSIPDQVKWCPMNEEPLNLVPAEQRAALAAELNRTQPSGSHKVNIKFNLCPCCQQEFRDLMAEHAGDWSKVIEQVAVKRVVISERDRIGIGTFQPKDEKNQDSTELSGDINYRKIAKYGTDSDPRAFNFDGEFNVANRGLIEFVEVLKLDTAFLYDLLGAAQERTIKPKKFQQTDIDEVIIGHTNNPEYLKLIEDDLMEAFRDRTLKIDIMYNTKVSNEAKIYQKTLHGFEDRIAPHALEVAALWAVATRLSEPSHPNLSLMQKIRLYDGSELAGFNQKDARELRETNGSEGMSGISPRYIQDTLGVALVRHSALTARVVLTELAAGLRNNSLISNENDRGRYVSLLEHVHREYDEIVKAEVHQAACADPAKLEALCSNYVDNVLAYIAKKRAVSTEAKLDERLMRSVEERLEIPHSRKDDFRLELSHHLEQLEERSEKFRYDSNPRLKAALEQKLFEDEKDTLKLALGSKVSMTPALQERIDQIRENLMKMFGYSGPQADEVMVIASDIYSRGEPPIKKEAA